MTPSGFNPRPTESCIKATGTTTQTLKEYVKGSNRSIFNRSAISVFMGAWQPPDDRTTQRVVLFSPLAARFNFSRPLLMVLQ